MREVVGGHDDPGPGRNRPDEAVPGDHRVGKDEQQGRTPESGGACPVVLERAIKHCGDDQPVDGDADAFGRKRGLGDDGGEKEDEQRDSDGQRNRTEPAPRPGQEPAHIGDMRQREEGHLGNEQPPGTHGIPGGGKQEGEPEREQFPTSRQEGRQGQQEEVETTAASEEAEEVSEEAAEE